MTMPESPDQASDLSFVTADNRLIYMTKAIILSATIGIALLTPACSTTFKGIVVSNAHRDRWPDKLLDRHRHHADNGLVVYAQDWWIARKLARWTRTEISALEREYGIKLTSEIVVFAIEPGDEPVTAIEEWRKEHIHRERKIVWGRRVFHDGRPYCTAPYGDPGFRESFFMPLSELQRLGLITSNAKGPALVFFLTSDRHKNESFEKCHKEAKKTSVNDGDIWFLALMRAMISRDYKQRDLKLMRLQRRETLWTGLVHMSRGGGDKSELIARIAEQTDYGFQIIFESRPID